MFLRILTTAFLLGSLHCETYAQSSVTLNVNLYPIQTLMVNASQKEVNLEYNTREDYRNGVVSEQQDHLTIYSTGGFQVKVSAVTAAIDNGVLDNIIIMPSSGSKPLNQSHVVYTDKNISELEQPIISATKGAVDKNVNISYKGAGNDALMGFAKNNTSTNQSYTVVYTIVSQ